MILITCFHSIKLFKILFFAVKRMVYNVIVHVYFIEFHRYVADKMGGPIEKGQLTNFSWELPVSQVKYDLKCNVVPIGKIKAGIHIHRALLFKVGRM